MSVQPRSAPVPTPQKWWVERKSSADRRSALIVERLEIIANGREGSDVATIREFLTAWRNALVAGNNPGMTLKVSMMPKRPNQAIVFAVVPGVRHVSEVPILSVPWSHHFERILRECGEWERFPRDRVRKTDVWGQPERPRRPPVLGKVNIELLSIP